MKIKDGKQLIITEDNTLSAFGFENIYNEQAKLIKNKKQKKDKEKNKQNNK